jgi:hypothetical protein
LKKSVDRMSIRKRWLSMFALLVAPTAILAHPFYHQNEISEISRCANAPSTPVAQCELSNDETNRDRNVESEPAVDVQCPKILFIGLLPQPPSHKDLRFPQDNYCLLSDCTNVLFAKYYYLLAIHPPPFV